MARKASSLKLPLILILLLACLGPARAEEPARSRWLREVGVNVGYGMSPVNNGTYEFVALLPQVGFDLGEAFGLAGLRPPGSLEVVFEPLANVVTEPRLDFEGGAGLLLKYGLRWGRFLPYLEAGAGIVYSGGSVPEQSAGCNFIPQAGPGIHFFLSPNWALTLSYRFRHLSNSGLSKPNHGINSDLFLIGASFIFEPARPVEAARP